MAREGQRAAALAAGALKNRLAAAAREDINAFMAFVFKIKQSECHKEMQRHLATEPRAGILAQREGGKTTQAIGYLLWRLGRDPDLLIKLICSTDDMAKDRIMLIRDVISRNPNLHRVFPNLVRHPTIEDWGKHSLTVKRKRFSKDSSIQACGILTTATGGRANLILFDDIVDFQNAIKFPSQREQVKQVVFNVWIPMLGPDGKAAYLATRYHEEDLTTELMKNPKWKFIDLSVTGDPPVSAWPERWTTEALLARKVEIGSVEFDRSMRNLLHPDRERIVQQGWIQRFSAAPARSAFRYSSWDFAASGKEGDYTARTSLEASPDERLIRVLSIERRRGLTYNEMIDWMIADHADTEPDEVIIEQTGFQVVMGRDERIQLLPVHHFVPKVSKIQRVMQTAVLYERGMITFRDGTCEVGIEELLGFPRGSHDDCVDSLTQGVLRAMEVIGKPFRPDLATGSKPRIFSTRPGEVDEEAVPGSRAPADVKWRGSRRMKFRSTRW